MEHFTSFFGSITDVHSTPSLYRRGEQFLAIVILLLCATAVSSQVVELLVGEPPETNRRGKRHDKGSSHGSGEPEIAPSTPLGPMPEFSDNGSGQLIGYVERLLVVVFIAMGAFTDISFIAAAKSLIRIGKMDESEFAEYFLIGTLLSILCGILCGLGVRWVLTW